MNHGLFLRIMAEVAAKPAVAPAKLIDLGMDSLDMVYLLGRLESAFNVHLPEDVLEDAETVGDLWSAVKMAAR